ncbi:MAG TPA: chromosome partitioning protein ParB, partial [Xanthobacteraceae bacterium]|nr:chromosome partitioning protein ParB [Xanthobacteraceae bacterium]
DFLRRRIKRKVVVRDFDGALKKALKLAKSLDANYLPGWCGPVDEK